MNANRYAIRHISVASAAKFGLVLGAVTGLLSGLVSVLAVEALAGLIDPFGFTGVADNVNYARNVFVSVALGAFLGMVVAAIYSVIYNVTAAAMGGIVVELDGALPSAAGAGQPVALPVYPATLPAAPRVPAQAAQAGAAANYGPQAASYPPSSAQAGAAPYIPPQPYPAQPYAAQPNAAPQPAGAQPPYPAQQPYAAQQAGGQQAGGQQAAGAQPYAAQPYAAQPYTAQDSYAAPSGAQPAPDPSPFARPSPVPAPAPSGPYLSFAGPPAQNRAVRQPQTSLGSQPPCDMLINGAQPHHADIRYENGRWILYDLSNGQTWVNGRQVSNANMLKDGFTLRVGSEEMVFHA